MLRQSDKRVQITRQDASNIADLQYACILIMAFFALFFLPTRPSFAGAFLTLAPLTAFGVLVLVVVAAIASG